MKLILLWAQTVSERQLSPALFLQEYDHEFLNADEITQSHSAENPAEKRIHTGKLFFQKLNKAVIKRKSLLIEGILSGSYVEKFLIDLTTY